MNSEQKVKNVAFNQNYIPDDVIIFQKLHGLFNRQMYISIVNERTKIQNEKYLSRLIIDTSKISNFNQQISFEFKLHDFGIQEDIRPIFQIGTFQYDTLLVFGLINEYDFKIKLYRLGSNDNQVDEYEITNSKPQKYINNKNKLNNNENQEQSTNENINTDVTNNVHFGLNEQHRVSMIYQYGSFQVFINDQFVLKINHDFKQEELDQDMSTSFYDVKIMCAGQLGNNVNGIVKNVKVQMIDQ